MAETPIDLPLALRAARRVGPRRRALAAAGRTLGRVPKLRPILFGTVVALGVGVAADIGPWTALRNALLLTADAQEAPRRPTALPGAQEPSEADRAALRYFAREGEVDRLEAELRRLRALYPGWQPPRDLLDPQGEDLELQRIYDLVGAQRYEDARRAIADRQQRDPEFVPPGRLTALIELGQIRATLRAASDLADYPEVLRLAEANERVLTCEDVDSIWRVAQAFARSGRPDRAYDAYLYVIASCTDPTAKAASLQKAAGELDPADVTRLFAAGGGSAEFTSAQLDIIRGAMARAGDVEGTEIPAEWLGILADAARGGGNLEDAMLIGYYLYRRGLPGDGAQWFRFALDRGLGSEAAEGYVVALRATGERDDEFLAREVAYAWREETPELMEAYLDAVSTVLTADELGRTVIEDVEQSTVDRFVPVVIQQRDANGAQALGWYAFNTCQFVIAEEWFVSSANWVPTEASLFGLALARLRLGDRSGFEEVVDEWGELYRSVRGLATGDDLDPADPVTGSADDPTDEVGVASVICDPSERQRLRRQLTAIRGDRAEALVSTEAGSLTAVPAIRVDALARRPEGSARPATPSLSVMRRSDVAAPSFSLPAPSLFLPAQATVPMPTPAGPSAPLPTPDAAVDAAPTPAPLSLRPGAAQQPRPAAVEAADEETAIRQRALGGEPRFRDTRAETTVRRRRLREEDGDVEVNRDRPADVVTRRVRQAESRRDEVDAEVRRIVSRTGSSLASPRRQAGSTGGTGAQQALAARNFARCVALTDSAAYGGRISGADASARGFCLLELRRPVEASQAFQIAKSRTASGSAARSDAVYGATLAALATGSVSQAAIEATQAPLSRARRTELQAEILTQRAVEANRRGRSAETLYLLNERNKIAPLQKDLMLLQGFAYRDAGDGVSARRVFTAVDEAGPTSQSSRALNDSSDAFIGTLRGGRGGNYK